ncbi:MAG: sulfotransferase domain-containing protein, partial [Pseudomonadota bacterium]
ETRSPKRRHRRQQQRRMPMDAWMAFYLNGAMSCGSYFDHVARWHAAPRASNAVLFMTYEDMKRDPVGTVFKVGEFASDSRPV